MLVRLAISRPCTTIRSYMTRSWNRARSMRATQAKSLGICFCGDSGLVYPPESVRRFSITLLRFRPRRHGRAGRTALRTGRGLLLFQLQPRRFGGFEREPRLVAERLPALIGRVAAQPR